MCLGSCFVLLLIFEIHPQGTSYLTILPYYSLCKMAIFSTFWNGVIFQILNIFLSRFPIKHLLFVFRVIFCDFWSSKFSPKVVRFWRFCPTIPITKWPFLPLSKMMAESEIFRIRKLGESGGIFWQHFPKDIFQRTFQKKKKYKIQSQVKTLEMPFSYNRKSTNFLNTHVRICVKNATPLNLQTCISTASLRQQRASIRLWGTRMT